MLRSIANIWRKLCDEEKGNVAILFGASAIPLLLIMGGAIDFTRYNRYKAELSNAVDSAALTLARNVDNYDSTCPEPDEGATPVLCAAATTATTNFVAAFNIPDSKFTITEVKAKRAYGGFVVSAKGNMVTLFLPLANTTSLGSRISSIGMDIVAQVEESSNRVEVALVIDNTGSMNCGNVQSGTCYNNYSNPGTSSRIYAVKQAATTMINTLMRDNLEDPDQIKIALVPFEGAVNVGITSGPNATPSKNWVTPPTWIDWNINTTTPSQMTTTYGFGRAKYNGVNFEKWTFGGSATCTTGTNCKYVGAGWMYRKLDVLWAGCVEMRPYSATASSNYELTDLPPNTSVPNSLWTPYFWPDEPDTSSAGNNTTKNNNQGYTFTNNYLNDRNSSSTAAAAQAALAKYYPGTTTAVTWQTGAKATSAVAAPYTKGPNYGCPNPIIPLTSGTATGKQALLDGINGMVAYYSTGTYIPAGLMWGWHVLSPTLPFTQGTKPGDEYYEQTVKAIVLFTDGDNTVNTGGSPNGSFYSAWGYIAEKDPDNTYRLGSNATNAEAALNTKTSTACANAKAAGIRIYTISFGSLTTDTQTMMRNCATSDDGAQLYYNAPNTASLQDIFRRIGDDLTEIHLSM